MKTYEERAASVLKKAEKKRRQQKIRFTSLLSCLCICFLVMNAIIFALPDEPNKSAPSAPSLEDSEGIASDGNFQPPTVSSEAYWEDMGPHEEMAPGEELDSEEESSESSIQPEA